MALVFGGHDFDIVNQLSEVHDQRLEDRFIAVPFLVNLVLVLELEVGIYFDV